jgi:DNA-directed RNA polymerase specialized sigma24 family protein
MLAIRILQIASALPDERARYVLLHQSKGFTLEEIGETLSLSKAAVRLIAGKAARLIREKMQEHGSLAA